MLRHEPFSLISATAVLVLLAGCGGDDGSPPGDSGNGAGYDHGTPTGAWPDSTDSTQTPGMPGPDGTSGTGDPAGDLPAELPPDISNPNQYPLCNNDPASQASPCIDEAGAVRCKVNSGYPGDELALCDPAPDGMLLHFGPRDYDDPDEVRHYLLPPGGEDEFCKYIITPNDEERWFNAYHGRMRPGSHHLIVTMTGPQQPSAVPFSCGPSVQEQWLFGSQDPQIDVATGGAAVGQITPTPDDPDYNVAQVVPPRVVLRFNFHHINTSPDTILREAWTTLMFHPNPDEIRGKVDMITFYQGSINVPPQGTATTTRATCRAPTRRYVSLLTGHAHEALTRFSIWHNGASGSRLVYQTHDYAEPGNAYYRDGIENPPLEQAELNGWGATSGFLLVEQGESLSFECEYRNTTNRTKTFGTTGADEMCNVFGAFYPSTGPQWNCACYGPLCL